MGSVKMATRLFSLSYEEKTVGSSFEINYLTRPLKCLQPSILYKVSTLLFIFYIGFSGNAYGVDLEVLKTKLEADPNNLSLRQDLGQLYFENQNWNLAIETLKPKAEKLDQNGLSTLALSYGKIDDLANEGKLLEQLTVNYPKYTEGFVLLGNHYFNKTKIKSDARIAMNCLAAYKKAIELNPAHRPAYDGLLKAYDQFKNPYELRVLLGDMAKRFGKKPDIIGQLCQRFTEWGVFAEARHHCIEAINLDANKPENYVYLALIENNEGNVKKADSLLKKVTAKFESSEFAQSNYADFLTQQKNLPGAEASYSMAVKADPKSYRAQIGLAQTSFELRHYESALESFKQACEIMPHWGYRLIRKAADTLRHRSEAKLEAQYANAMEKCLPEKDDNRSPASTKEDFRSPFAIYAKTK